MKSRSTPPSSSTSQPQNLSMMTHLANPNIAERDRAGTFDQSNGFLRTMNGGNPQRPCCQNKTCRERLSERMPDLVDFCF